MISRKHKFVFVHIARTGGMSVEAVLEPWCKKYKLHQTTKEIIDELGRDEFDNYFSFSIVRNPWDRMVSNFHHWKQNIAARDPGTGKVTDEKRIPSDMTFIQWLKNQEIVMKRVAPGLRQKIREHTMSQFYWLTDYNNTIAVDCVIKFENLNASWNVVRSQLEKRCGILPAALPHRNKSKHKHYSLYYNDEAIELVRNVVLDDIREFGYEFEDRRQK